MASTTIQRVDRGERGPWQVLLYKGLIEVREVHGKYYYTRVDRGERGPWQILLYKG